MRAILHSDVRAATRVLLAVPPALRRSLCQRMMREAHWADGYVKRIGKTHSLWGNGTLRASANTRRLGPEPAVGAQEYAHCLAIVLDLVMTRSWSTLE